ncbi:MAG: hypothetical protein ABSB83_03665 [Methanomassiliicoccales archaeon]
MSLDFSFKPLIIGIKKGDLFAVRGPYASISSGGNTTVCLVSDVVDAIIVKSV